MKATRASSLVIIVTSLIFVGAEVSSWGQASGNITGAQFSRDGKQISVQSDGPVGRHNAFVLAHPNRLVVDFPENGFKGIPRKIGGVSPGVKEIRLGHFNSRARVVVDFGESPVPPYRIHPEGARVLVVFGKPMAAAPESPRFRKPVLSVKPSAKEQSSGTRESPGDKKMPPLSIKSANVVGDLIVLQLSDPKNPQRSCRLVMEVNLDRLQVVRTTLSDAKGNLKSSDVTHERLDSDEAGHQGSVQRGPRKQADISDQEMPQPPTFKWGLPEVKRMEPSPKRETASGTFRFEHWVFQKRPETGG